nr:nuclear transport factor 2 family protein [Granulicella aggregans]
MSLETSVEVWGRLKQDRAPVEIARSITRSIARSIDHGTKRVLAILLLAVAVLGIAGIAHAQNAHKEHKRDYKREIELVEQQWRTAQLAGDVATMDKLLAEDYFGISNNGQLNNKTQQLERLQKRTLVLTKIDVSDVKIKLLGRVGIVTSLAQLEGTNDGRPLQGLFRYTRIYKRYPDGSWKITNFEVTHVPNKGERGGPTD